MDARGLLGHVELAADLAVRAPAATSASTWRSRGVSPNGSSVRPCRPRRRAPRRASRSRARARAPRPRPRARRRRALRRLEAAARGARRGLAVARGEQRLGLAPARVARGVGPPERLPAPRPRRPQAPGRRRRRRGAWSACARGEGGASTARRPRAQPRARISLGVRAHEAAATSPRSRAAGRRRPRREPGRGQRAIRSDVLGAELDPVERVVDRRARGRRGRRRAPLELGLQRAEQAEVLRLARVGGDALGRVERLARPARGRRARARARPPQRSPVGERQPGAPRPRPGERGLGRLPVAGVEAELEQRSASQRGAPRARRGRRRALARRRRAPPRPAGEVERVAQVDRGGDVLAGARPRAPSRAPRAARSAPSSTRRARRSRRPAR